MFSNTKKHFDVFILIFLFPTNNVDEQRCAEKRQQSQIDGSELEKFRSWIDDMIRDTCSSHVLEVMLQNCSDALFLDILNRIFSGHIATYATLPICNFVVQQLITCVRSSDQLERVR